jgi:hypothetical protein
MNAAVPCVKSEVSAAEWALRVRGLLTAGESIADACARLPGLAAQARRLDASYRT